MNDPRRCVVMFATADWATPYWTNSQHTASQLASRGYRVLFVETVGIRRPRFDIKDAGRIARRLGRGLSSIREVQERVWVLSPLTIPGARRSPLLSGFNDWQLRRRVARWIAKQGVEHPLVWSYHPFMLNAAEALDPTAIIYHCVDDVGALPDVDRPRYDEAEHKLISRSDHVFVTSRALRDRCSAIAPTRTHYFPNVADLDHFAAARSEGPIPSDLAAIARPRIGYVGVLSDFKLDLTLLESAVRQRDDWHWVFIGGERDGQASPELTRLKCRSNVHLLGWRPYSSLPNYLRGIDVALLPQQLNDYTRAMFPMKFFEYLAAGRPVVATPLPALVEFRDLFRTAATADDMVVEINAALAERGDRVLPADDPILRTHTWAARLDRMLAIVDGQTSAAE